MSYIALYQGTASEAAEKVRNADSSWAEAHSEWQEERTCTAHLKVRPFKTHGKCLFSAASSAVPSWSNTSLAALETRQTNWHQIGCHAEFPLRRDLPDDAATKPTAVARKSALRCGAIEITAAVDYHVTDRICPVVAASEVVQRGVGPVGVCQLENVASIMSAVAIGCAVEIARPVDGESAPGPTLARGSGKAVKGFQCPTASVQGRQLENRAAATGAAVAGGAVKVARLVKYQAGVEITSVVSAPKVVETTLLRPARVHQLENRAVAT